VFEGLEVAGEGGGAREVETVLIQVQLHVIVQELDIGLRGGAPNFENQGAGEGWGLVLLEVKGREQHGDGGVMRRQDDHPSV